MIGSVSLKYIISTIILTMAFSAYSQNFSIQSLEYLPTDLTASTQARTDLNGNKCGLVKVQCVLDNVKFSGNIIGNVEHKDGEYWVYLTKGSKQLYINHSMVLPLEVDLSKNNDVGILPGACYRLILSIHNALYPYILNSNQASKFSVDNSNSNTIISPNANNSNKNNTTISGIITDEKDGEPLIGCAVYYGNSDRGSATDLDGKYILQNVRPGSTIRVSYVGYKTREITFTGNIPPRLDISLKSGRGTSKENYYYNPNDTSEYFDLDGNKLLNRPSKKGTYIRIVNGKAEKFVIN